MEILKKIWNFLFGSKEEPVVLEETPAEEKEAVAHCVTHTRFPQITKIATHGCSSKTRWKYFVIFNVQKL